MDNIFGYGIIALKFSDKQKKDEKKDHRNISHVFMITILDVHNNYEKVYPGKWYDKDAAIAIAKTKMLEIMQWSYGPHGYWRHMGQAIIETVGKEQYLASMNWDTGKAVVTDVLPNLLDYRYLSGLT